MRGVKYCPTKGAYFQAIQEGGLPYYRGYLVPPQEGFGLFSSIIKTAIPFGKGIFQKAVKPLVKSIGPQIVKNVAEGVGDVVSGKKTIKGALADTTKKTLKDSTKVIKKQVFKQKGGSAVKRKLPISKYSSKRRKKDIFDYGVGKCGYPTSDTP